MRNKYGTPFCYVPIITNFLHEKYFKTFCNYNSIIVVVSFSVQRLFSKKYFFICFSIKRERDFCQGVWVLPTSFLHLSALTIFFENVECGHKCYACCQRSGRKHSLQKADCVYTQAMLALI